VALAHTWNGMLTLGARIKTPLTQPQRT